MVHSQLSFLASVIKMDAKRWYDNVGSPSTVADLVTVLQHYRKPIISESHVDSTVGKLDMSLPVGGRALAFTHLPWEG